MSNTAHNDGGPAFSGIRGSHGYGTDTVAFGPDGAPIFTEHNQGMSLRDWFAGQALQGMLAAPITDGDVVTNPMDWRHDQFAQAAYMQADAMLKAREVKP